MWFIEVGGRNARVVLVEWHCSVLFIESQSHDQKSAAASNGPMKPNNVACFCVFSYAYVRSGQDPSAPEIKNHQQQRRSHATLAATHSEHASCRWGRPQYGSSNAADSLASRSRDTMVVQLQDFSSGNPDLCHDGQQDPQIDPHDARMGQAYGASPELLVHGCQ